MESTSGHEDGVRVENFFSWTIAQIHPSTAGPWQEAECTNQNLQRNLLQDTCQWDQTSLNRNFRGRNKEKQAQINL